MMFFKKRVVFGVCPLFTFNVQGKVHNGKRNMGQGNFYLIMTLQTNYLTVCKIWCLKPAKNFIKNICLIGKYKTKKGDIP